MTFSGASVAIVTPFVNGQVDEQSLRQHVDFLIENGIQGIVPCGTTGESPTLSDEEKVFIVQTCKAQARGRVPIIAGAGSNNTAHATHLSKLLAEAGADALLQVSPYYNKPTQEGLFQHFSAIANATSLPIILYNVPGRTSVDIQVDTIARLASTCPTIVGVKECVGPDRVKLLREKLPKTFTILSGEDGQNVAFYQAGATGCISVTGNVAPREVATIWKSAAEGKWNEASTLQEKLQTLNQILFVETNPIPVKTALAMMGRVKEEFRLPLCAISAQNRSQLQSVVSQYNLQSV